MKRYRFVLLVQQNYTFEILRPMQKIMRERGDEILWLALGKAVNTSLFHEDENMTTSIADAVKFNPHAVFVTGNVVPDFIPGLKVQLFHGFEWKKKGHFRIRGSFDLYCTQGPFFTTRFEEFAQQHGYFDVVETGWPKMDNVFPVGASSAERSKKQILYVPTFSPRLTSVYDLLPELDKLAAQNRHDIIVKFHPKMANDAIQLYQSMVSKHPNMHIVDSSDVMTLIRDCDLVLSDTSSVIAESLLLHKPVVTYKNSLPDEYLCNFEDAEKLVEVIDSVFANSDVQADNFALFAQQYHPFNDGRSSQRIIDEAIKRIEYGLDAKGKKPANFLRNLKLRKQENYWPWTRNNSLHLGK
ncbi:CDP-glycerol glycerophosphotransferase family protein [Glaciecola sp. MH2013]|uniref:CDP-glycerol glycerophosphotransferase family protein n=1 Tax=Glaciecola sp. MH2013 TaxID=2785524 RepID=UPI00189F04F5|nr:CDP-glycerol glycerophosphotransferase family protein [Glaciecola sp. MH2013]MBF7073363.1 CDP-glycerol glycerophosphotransferase family protein [Glaciecola sp. MH2013]